MKKEIILFRGLPGSGKSSLAESLCEVVISADQFFEDGKGNYNFDFAKLKDAHADCLLRTRGCMHLETSIIGVANTFTQEWEMKPYFDLAKEFGYRISTIVVENRHGSTNVHDVSNEALDRMESRFQIKLR